mmetsp:Transcript_13833/g.39755  ORF Transcript_13833/g.39755 Transcript_13833/m.39755 type:complete len:229 (-) Transcript_13833:472-1158(-)
MGLRLGEFLALVVSSEAVVVVGKVIHTLLVLEEGGEGLPIGIVGWILAVAERGMQIVQIEVGDSAGIGGSLGGGTMSISGIISGGSDIVLSTAFSAAKVSTTVVAEADPAEVMATLASHVIAAAILFDLDVAFGTILDGRARLASHTSKQIVVGEGVEIRAGLPFRVRVFAASEAEGRCAGAAGARRYLPIDTIEQIPAATDGHAVAVGTGTPSKRFHPATGNERVQL